MSPQAGDKAGDDRDSRSRELLANGYPEDIPHEGVPMATRDQIRALLAVPCPWCHAAVGELCSAPGARDPHTEGPRRSDRRPIRTLDAGCHDARWLRALDEPAPVRAEVVAEEHPPRHGEAAEPVLVGAPTERPW